MSTTPPSDSYDVKADGPAVRRAWTRILALALALAACLLALVAPATPAPGAGAASCTDPQFVTSDPNGSWTDRGYIVHNHMWNAAGYDVSETLRACSFRNWNVTATADNSSGDGAVKTYPNVHKDFFNGATGSEPKLSSFSRIRSSFEARTPRRGIYNAAYDIWLNGVPGEHEVMIWTFNRRQVPAGSVVGHHRFAGHRWTLWATDDNGYIALVPDRRLTHGTLPLRRILAWLVDRGRLEHDVTVGQICFGFEIVSTGGRPATFYVSDFSLKTRRR